MGSNEGRQVGGAKGETHLRRNLEPNNFAKG